jgi:hypothetical protein
MMAYQLLFCLICEDTGTQYNPALSPILDKDGTVQLFNGLDEAHRAINRLRRLANGLIYYASAVDLIEPPVDRSDRQILRSW